MAIAFDAAVTTAGAATPQTISNVVVAATNRILFVAFGNNAASDTATGVTYNGVSMTRVSATAGTSGNYLYLYAIVGQSGTHNVVITLSSGAIYRSTCASYTGVNQSITWTGGSPTDNTAVQSGTGTSVTQSVTTIADNSWVFTCCWEDNGVANTTTTNITIRGTAQIVTQAGDSNAAVTPAGAYSQTWNSDGTSKWGMIQASFSPAVAAGPANLKSYNTNLKANIKSIDTNLIANVKSLDTNA